MGYKYFKRDYYVKDEDQSGEIEASKIKFVWDNNFIIVASTIREM